ncbi:MAG: methylated-DNA--[protein]-cysteine S-methyltransferase [Nitrospinaceae bacterium]
MKANPIYYTVFSTPLGLAGIAGSSKGLCRISLDIGNEAEFVDFLNRTPVPSPIKNLQGFANVIKQFQLYFAGQLTCFTCKLDLSAGTPFQQKVWRKLMTIPHGTTRSYRWLAGAIQHPKAFRAVGGANGKNPLPIIIPCHRVIRENGDLGGYTGGLGIKRFLLDLERVSHGVV